MTSRFRRPLQSTLTAAALLVAPAALADWAGELRVRTSVPPAPEQKGKAYGRKSLMRLDLEPPEKGRATSVDHTSLLLDLRKSTGLSVAHKQRVATAHELSELPVRVPGPCTDPRQDLDACLVARGYKKTGSARVNGQVTTLYEVSFPGADGKPWRQKVWRPTDLPEVPYVRVQTFDGAGLLRSGLDVLDIQVGPQPDSRFTVPADYQQRGGQIPSARLQGLKVEDLQGRSPKEAEKLFRDRLKVPKSRGE
jgi:hypothetical protein